MEVSKHIRELNPYEYKRVESDDIDIEVSATNIKLENVQVKVTFEYSKEYRKAKELAP